MPMEIGRFGGDSCRLRRLEFARQPLPCRPLRQDSLSFPVDPSAGQGAKRQRLSEDRREGS